MDESEWKVDSQTPGGTPGEGETGGPAQGRREPEPARAVSPVSLEIRRDETPSGTGKDLQKGKRSRLPVVQETPTTDRQRIFVKNYLTNGRNKVQAFLKATPQAKRKKQSKIALEVKARKMLHSAGVQYLLQRADDYKGVSVKPVFEKYAITEARIAEELAKIAFSDPTQVMSWDGTKVNVKASSELSDEVKGTIAEVRPTRDGVMVKQHDKVNALLQLGRTLGMFDSGDKGGSDNRVAVQFIIRKD